MDDATYEKMKKVKEDFHPQAMSIPGVHGTSIGLKEVAGTLTDTFAIVIHLTEKRSLDDVAVDERIPEEIEGFPTDVIEHEQPSTSVGDVRHLSQSADDAKYRPLEGGAQLRSPEMYGTLGCMVYEVVNDGSNQKTVYYVLSNKHVLGDVENSTFQPEYNHKDRIGNVVRNSGSSNKVDAAISSIQWYDDAGVARIVDIGNVEGTYTLGPNDLPYYVQKRGAITGLRVGAISQIDYSGDRNDGWHFEGQYYISAKINFAEPGDSGSAVVDLDNKVVGLLWGTALSGSIYMGCASPINLVLQKLSVQMLTFEESFALPPYSETLTDKLEALLNQSSRGQGYWEAWREHKIYLLERFHQTARLQAIWQKTPEVELRDMMRSAALNPDSKIPSTIGTEDTVQVFKKLRDGLKKYLETDQKGELKGQIDSFCQFVEDNIGRSWSEALSD